MSSIKIHSDKEFLNKPFNHSDASIFSSITIGESKNEQKELTHVNLYANLKIRDCDRTISLAVDAETDEEVDNLMFKIDTIVKHLIRFKQAHKIAHKQYKKLKSQIKK